MSNTNNRNFWNSRNRTAPTFNYTPSETVNTAWGDYNNYMNNNKPGNYAGTWLDEIKDVTDQILNRKDFSYDLNGDALYQQYKDQAVTQGKLASMDAIGQAAAMTGGHGNSYAQSVGQQAYQGYLQGLNDNIPELYQIALDQHNSELQDLYNQYGLYADRDAQEFSRNQAEWDNYYRQLGVLYDNAKYLSDTEYNQALNNFNIDYGVHRDSVADSQWQTQFDSNQASGDGEPVTEFNKAVFSRVDADGNYVFYIDGKEHTYAPGVNPYTGTKNSDVKNGTFSNGYQPNNINGQKLSKSGITDVVNGVTQNVWKTPDGKLWIWDGTENRYLEYDG